MPSRLKGAGRFLDKGQNAVITFDEVGAYQIVVVIAINLSLSPINVIWVC